MFCKYCGKYVSDNAQFCASCGKPIASPSQTVTYTPPVEQRVVSSEGVVPSVKAAANDAGVAKREVKKGGRGKIIAIVVVVITIALLVCLLMLTSFGKQLRTSINEETGINLPGREAEYKISKRTYIDPYGLIFENSYEFDSEGRVISDISNEDYKDTSSSGGVSTEHTQVTISYIGDTDIVSKKVVDGAEKASDNGEFTRTLHLSPNEHGDSTETIIEDYDGSKYTIRTEFEYYPSGKKKRYVSTYEYDNPSEEERKTESVEGVYDENGETLSYKCCYTNGGIYESTYELTEDGTPISRTDRSKDNSSSDESIFSYTYDEYGNVTSETGNAGSIESYELTLDNEGRVVVQTLPETTRTSDTSPGGSYTVGRKITEYGYDEHGNVISEVCTSYKAGSDEINYKTEKYYEYVLV